MSRSCLHVLEPIGSAGLTFDDDLYYELSDLMNRSLFGVPDEITDMTRSLEKVECRRGYQNPLIRLQRIYNFLLLHAILSSVLDMIGLYYSLLYYFWD